MNGHIDDTHRGPPQSRRRRRRRLGEQGRVSENSNILEFGQDFPPGSEHVCIAEASIILAPRKLMMNQTEHANNDTLLKTMSYCSTFSPAIDPDRMKMIREFITTVVGGLDTFEIGKLLDLRCDDIEQIKILIPSLARLTEEELGALVTFSVGLNEEEMADVMAIDNSNISAGGASMAGAAAGDYYDNYQ
ncbi:hypothetical protein SeLEV6574_g03108 [Synchytrium endobioticum]|nr:hypothetical protein SeLEV6574_g03108 [Synchytrium endobioticum]